MALSSPSLDLVRKLFETWNRGDREALFEVVDSDSEVHSRLGSLRGAPYRGAEGLREWLSDIDEQFSGFDVSIEEIRELETGCVFVEGTISFRGRSSDLAWEQDTIWIFDVEAGRVRRLEVYTDREEGLRAAGVGE